MTRSLASLVVPAVTLWISGVAAFHAPEASAITRPSAKKFSQMIVASTVPTAQGKRIDANLLRSALMRENPQSRLKKACLVAANDAVACVDIDQMGNTLSPADRALLNLGLNDFLDLAGAQAGMDVLAVCGSSSARGLTHVIPMSSSQGSSGNAGKGGGILGGGVSMSQAAQGPGVGGRLQAGQGSRPIGGGVGTGPSSIEDSARSACRNAQMSKIRGQMGAFTPGDPGYEAAVSSAVAAMDEASAQCRDSGNGAIANPGRDNASSAADKDQSNARALDKVVGVMSTAAGGADAALEVGAAASSEIAKEVGSSKGGSYGSAVVKAAGTLLTALGVVDNETAEAAGTLVDVATTGATVMEAYTTAAVATASAATVLTVVSTAAVAYGTTRALDQATGGFWSKQAVKAVGWVSDKVWEASNGKSSGGASIKNPDSSGGCAEAKKRWEDFEEYCSQPGNNWQSFDCVAFVAKANKCADPRVIQPGPESDFVCVAKKDKNAQLIAVCENQSKLRDRLSIPSEGRSASCAQKVGALNDNTDFFSLVEKKICSQATADPNSDSGGICQSPPVGGGSAPAAPSRNSSRGPTRPPGG